MEFGPSDDRAPHMGTARTGLRRRDLGSRPRAADLTPLPLPGGRFAGTSRSSSQPSLGKDGAAWLSGSARGCAASLASYSLSGTVWSVSLVGSGAVVVDLESALVSNMAGVSRLARLLGGRASHPQKHTHTHTNIVGGREHHKKARLVAPQTGPNFI